MPLQGVSADGWRAAAYDHRGSGASVFPAGAITARALVDDVFRVMDAVGFDSCVLGGESMGSVVAMLAAHAHPERIEGLVLCLLCPLSPSARGRCGRGGNATSRGSAGGSSTPACPSRRPRT